MQAQGKSENIIKQLDRYVQIDDASATADERPPTPDFRVELGRSYLFSQMPIKSIETLDVLLETVSRGRARQTGLRIRGDAYLGIGKQKEAIADYLAAKDINPKDNGVLNNLAWVYATSPIDELRNGEEAIKLATEACRLTSYKEAHILSTLAAAYAESGQFEKAIDWSTKAVKLSSEDETSDEETRRQLKNELESYKQDKPWRELQDMTNQQEEVSGPEETGGDQEAAEEADSDSEESEQVEEEEEEDKVVPTP